MPARKKKKKKPRKKSRLGIINLVEIASEKNTDRYFQKRTIQPDQYALRHWLRFINKTQWRIAGEFASNLRIGYLPFSGKA